MNEIDKNEAGFTAANRPWRDMEADRERQLQNVRRELGVRNHSGAELLEAIQRRVNRLPILIQVERDSAAIEKDLDIILGGVEVGLEVQEIRALERELTALARAIDEAAAADGDSAFESERFRKLNEWMTTDPLDEEGGAA